MNAISSVSATVETRSAAPVTDDEKKLKKATGDLEGLFVSQLFKAMRDTVPQEEGIVSGGSGEDIFTGLLDEHLAAETPKHWSGGISEALYRQLRKGLGSQQAPAAATPPGAVTAAQSYSSAISPDQSAR